jgi:ferredoxin--NADP+ reductase
VPALTELRRLNLEGIDIIGRRGPLQASFTIKELRELGRLSNVNFQVNADELRLGMNPASLTEAEGNRPKIRILELLKSFPTNSESSTSKDKVPVHLRFLLKPLQVLTETAGKVTGVKFERTCLAGPPHRQEARGTGEIISIPCDLIITSLGYLNLPLVDIPFSIASNSIPHKEGRVFRSNDSLVSIPGLYVSGWLKRGAKGKVVHKFAYIAC